MSTARLGQLPGKDGATMAGKTIELKNFIDGQSVPALSGETASVLNPATGEVLAEMPRSSEADVDRAVAAASRAFPGWAATTPGARARLLLELADAIEERAEELAGLEALDAGKPRRAVLADEMPFICDNLRFFAGAGRLLDGVASGEFVAGRSSLIRREPVGVVGQVTPWNYPLMMAIWKIGPALATGNTVVLKPAETTPVTTVRLAEIAGGILPPGVLNVVTGDGVPVGSSLVAHPDVAVVSLTGSLETGRHVATAAAHTLKRVQLELGGKAPVVVFDDVDLPRSAELIANAAFYNAGQDCTAATRVIVSERAYETMVTLLAQQAGQQRLGDTLDDATTLGPLNSQRQRERVAGLMDRRPASAEVVAGGAAVAGPGFFFEPTVVAGLRQEDELIQQEIFGPVITVQAFTDERQAVALANGTRYGLAASVWTQDVGRAHRVANALQFGCVWVNDHITVASEMPHGGYKQSGYGRDMSKYALEEYTHIKHMMINIEDWAGAKDSVASRQEDR